MERKLKKKSHFLGGGGGGRERKIKNFFGEGKFNENFIFTPVYSGEKIKHYLSLPSILKTHQEKSVVPAASSPVILVMLEMR